MYDLTYMWNLTKKKMITTRKNKATDAENGLVVVRDMEWAMGKMRKGGPKVQTSSYKVYKSWRCKV